MKNSQWFILVAVLWCPIAACANPLAENEVPRPLQPWIDWVLQDIPDYRCPFVYNRFEQKRCAFPSRLTLDLDEGSGRFSIDWRVFAETWVQLPGDIRSWPIGVTLNQESVPVMIREDRPHLRLQPGYFRITGRFSWDHLPEQLQIPEDTGLLGLTVDGKAIDFPLVNNGRLWLKARNLGPNVEDRLELQVFRRIDDEVPLEILTRLEFQVAGRNRELRLHRPMPDGFIPLRLTSPLPARLESDGSLVLQLRPGHWRIDLLGRHKGPVEQLSLNRGDETWPREEIWVFAARPYLRLVEIENVQSIDAQLSNLPDDWKSLPAYRVQDGDSMRFKVVRRGDPEPEPDRLKLERTLWLDFDGKGYTVNDQIQGRMTRSWRLNALSRMRPGKVGLDGRDQLITRLPGSQQQGIEVRKGDIDLSADSRIDAPIERINAVGWDQTFYEGRAVLHLPPGWRLLAAEGVDQVPDSWLSRWTLLDLFLVLIAALAIARLWNRWWGLFALLTLPLLWHESDAPRLIWLNILAALALLRVLPQGAMHRLIRFYRNASCLALLVILVPFMLAQVRTGLYPQLEKPRQGIAPSPHPVRARAATLAPAAPQALEAPQAEQPVLRKSLGEMLQAEDESFSQASEEPPELQRINPDAKVQTGPGLPQWQWTAIRLSWNGPVDRAQEIRFWYLGPGFTRTLNFLRAFSVAILAALLAGFLDRKARLPSALAGLLIVPALLMPAQPVEAAFPDPNLLEELQARLLKAPDCLPGCAGIAQLDLNMNAHTLQLELRVDVQERVAFPLPGEAKQWTAHQVSIDGEEAEALYRSPEGILWATLNPGQYRILLQGATPPTDQFSLSLPLNPHRLLVSAEGWRVEGIEENRSPQGQLHFTREHHEPAKESRPAIESELLPPFFRVERTLQLGLTWEVHTRIVRMSPPGAAIVAEIPLLAGESVITAAIPVREGKVLVNIPANRNGMEWRSVLEVSPSIRLEAAQTEQWTEVWRADISPIWHMQSQGIAVVHHQDQRGHWLPEWRPWPGESVTLSIERPEGVAGKTLTIDHSEIRVNPGIRVREISLRFTLRSSQGTQQIITLPEQADLQSVSIDARTQPIRQQGRLVTIPVKPGRQDILVNWRETIPISSLLKTPEVNLGTDSVNTNLSVDLGRDRWTLFTFGPALGPAVLFWGILVVIMIVSYFLGKISWTPLRYRQWFLLLVGLSQIPPEAALLVSGWLLVLGYRGVHPSPNRRSFNATQVGIAMLTVIAMVLLCYAIRQGLLGSPEMQISGNQSTALHLLWYQDRSQSILPEAGIVSVPLAVYRGLMLAWSLWLAIALLNWLKWGWHCFASGGIWKKSEAPNSVSSAEGMQS
ncbi:MAG: hypothetical protein ACU843_00125 [Gammaproteobacteria bacterium]